MTTDAARNAFLKRLDEARRQPHRIGESEIARMAQEAGLSVPGLAPRDTQEHPLQQREYRSL